MAPVRRFLNEPSELVREWTRSQIHLQPGLNIDEKFLVLYRDNAAHSGRVTVVSGGGSGHEPAHAGYLGEGMLDAAVIGALFASPNVRQIQRALELVSSPQGTVVVVKNYTGDKLNFALATERFKATTGKDVRMVLVNDDVAVGRSRGKFVGRRGLAGTVLVQKVVGAAAHHGLDIDNIVNLCNVISQGLGTIGASLEPCHVPGQLVVDGAKFSGIALGMGIHNEPAVKNLVATTTTRDLIAEMLDLLLDPAKPEHAFLSPEVGKRNGRLILMLNNLGGLSTIELGALTSIVLSQLEEKYSIVPCRVYAGTFLSALDGRGFSITVLSLDHSETASTILDLLDKPTTANGWASSIPSSQWKALSSASPSQNFLASQTLSNDRLFAQIIQSIFKEVTAREPMITRYDTILGDGDCGTTLLAGAKALADALQTGKLSLSSLSQGMATVAEIVTDAMGGTSGAIYGIFLSALAAGLAQAYDQDVGMNGRYFALALNQALDVLEKFTGARVGDRTLMDALIPFITVFDKASQEEDLVKSLELAVHQSAIGCENTRYLDSKYGRSTYVGNQSAGETNESDPIQIPDPGACGIVAVLTGLLRAVQYP
ncbi:dihydroxyacetone kinase Dak1 [Aspergillus costaricaensis CBS 115574]|uniref:Dihydroxyacetone kinase Dak1 n=1 Tax=Aspergillus costaricaensis CBS 115574 TaxID=1448317 RepID=A0ACD1IVJ0_9EURO|nr:dihydroxyacetone kinase Dak1 [Aspergillus costaricaensis CBS 115574]RAK94090.1 dihydroxyacetone kinase Dak1 [Aspergillus costaricaensis CBS 115574]